VDLDSVVHCEYRIECGTLLCYTRTEGMAEWVAGVFSQQLAKVAIISRVGFGTLTEIFPDTESAP
jgi:hypothetical protein